MAKAFVSYKHNTEPDQGLAEHFAQCLVQEGHDVFIDQQIQVGQEWPTVIKQKLQEADFLIVLISQHSIASEMIIEEVGIAYELKKQHEVPLILPVRVAYTGNLPYDLGAKLNRIQYVLWEKEGDQSYIVERLKQAMADRQPFPEIAPVTNLENPVALAADGNAVGDNTILSSPLPAFDSNWLRQLDNPTGAVRLNSPFYVEREVDEQVKMLVTETGRTIRIKGGRQIGKSSLLARLYQHTRDNGLPVVYIDFQEMDDNNFQNLGTLLLHLADLIADELGTNESSAPYWQTPLGPKNKLTKFLSREVLQLATTPVVLLMDEVDRVFRFDYRDDFFSLIRSWHNRRAIDQSLNRLNIVLAYSTEAFMFITDLNQSPFNVGDDFELNDFNRLQIETLNEQHGMPLHTSEDLDDFVNLFQGHPYLVRKAFYELVIQNKSFDEWMDRASDDDGPFIDHLHRYLWRLLAQPNLREAMKLVIRDRSCPTDAAFYQLRAAGLVRGTSRINVYPRCGLYEQYFSKHL